MPVLVLFLCLIGNYFTYHSKGDLVQVKDNIYSESGDLIREETKYLTFKEYIGEEYIKPGELIEGQYLNSISINTSISEDEMFNYFRTLNYTNSFDGIVPFFFLGDNETLMTGFTKGYGVLYYDDVSNISSSHNFMLLYVEVDLPNYSISCNCIYIGESFYNTLFELNLALLERFNCSTSGWQNSDYWNLNVDSDFYTIDFSSNSLPLLTTTPVFVSTLEKVDLSFFDITLLQTDKTFIKFQLPFLRNAFESVFNILEFESSYVSSFVLTSFTWMIQLLLLHVVVDTLAFIFKMYHKLMDKVV